jgi:hypothetical protein
VNRVLQFGRDVAGRVRRACFALRLGEPEVARRAAHAGRQLQVRAADEYARGYLAGWRECFNTCLEAVEEEMAAAEIVELRGAGFTVVDGGTKGAN